MILERIGSSVRMVAGAITLCGVDPSTPYRVPSQGFGDTDNPVAYDVISATNKLVLAVIANEGSANGVTTGSGQTQQWNDATTNATTSSNVVGVGSRSLGDTLVTIDFGLGASEHYNLCAVSIRPAGVIAVGNSPEGLQPVIQ